MTQEEKELVLQDLACRLTYSVKAHYKYYDFFGGEEQLADEGDGIITAVDTNLGNPIKINGYYIEVENVKPYLRPMSSMTEEEFKEYDKAVDLDVADSSETLKANLKAKSRVRVSKWYHGNDCLNKNMFDYRGLIPMGLALEAPEGMYK